jgi:hypothetical protein
MILHHETVIDGVIMYISIKMLRSLPFTDIFHIIVRTGTFNFSFLFERRWKKSYRFFKFPFSKRKERGKLKYFKRFAQFVLPIANDWSQCIFCFPNFFFVVQIICLLSIFFFFASFRATSFQHYWWFVITHDLYSMLEYSLHQLGAFQWTFPYTYLDFPLPLV